MSSGIAGQDQLFTINLTTGAATDIAEIHGSSNFDVNGLLYRSDGMLVGVEDDSNSLVVIDPHTGDVTTLASLPFTVGTAGAIFYRRHGRGYCRNGLALPYSFNPYSGAYSLIGSFSPGFTDPGITGLAGFNATTTPEPGALSLLGLGIAGTALIARRRRSSQSNKRERTCG